MRNSTQDKINRQERHFRREQRHEQKRILREQRHQNRRFRQNMSSTSTISETAQQSILTSKWFWPILCLVAAAIIWVAFTSKENFSWILIG